MKVNQQSASPKPPSATRTWRSSGSDEEEEKDIEIQCDEDLLQRISLVESQLIEVFDRQAAMTNSPTFDPSSLLPVTVATPSVLPILEPHAYPCPESFKLLPALPTNWPQAPVMMRPTVGSDTQIRGIRRAGEKRYQHFKGFCAGCILPVNTGRETPGQSLVVDFESPYFVGSLLMRIRDIPSVEITTDTHDGTSYFDGKRRRFQALVKGKFKTPLKMSECVTGQIFERPAGELPARLIVRGVIKFVSALAPNLEATLDGTQPRFLTPLVATAQTVMARDKKSSPPTECIVVGKEVEAEKLRNYNIYSGALDLEDPVEEPLASDPTSLMQAVPGASLGATKSVAARIKARKKAFNQLAAKKANDPVFDLNKEYTFEFFQHLLLFDQGELSVETPVGKVGLAKPLNGQPMKFMSAHKDPATEKLTFLWSFDLWHSSLYGHAAGISTPGEG